MNGKKEECFYFYLSNITEHTFFVNEMTKIFYYTKPTLWIRLAV